MRYIKEGDAYYPAKGNKKYPPGTVFYAEPTMSTYQEWTRADVDSAEHVTFVPMPVPSLVHPVLTEDGHQQIIMDVNNLKQQLIVGIPNRVPAMFWHAYKNCLDAWRELENFKRYGPKVAPWGKCPEGLPSYYCGWHYDPSAHSFGVDIDGRYIQAGMIYEEIEPGFLRPTGKTAPIGIKIIRKPKRDAKGRFTKREE